MDFLAIRTPIPMKADIKMSAVVDSKFLWLFQMFHIIFYILITTSNLVQNENDQNGKEVG